MFLMLIAGAGAPTVVTYAETLQTTPPHRLPSDYWHKPLPPQGAAPARWSTLERSLAPKACGTCHANQYKDWRTSLHARAFSPGLVGQILTYDDQQARECMDCHAPLAEQKSAFETARQGNNADLPSGQGLAAAGNSCSGCHLREYRRHGPPQTATGVTGQSDPKGTHGGVFRTADFEKSEFCATCHQFPESYAINGKPLENTIVEWRKSVFANNKITCQSCHMPSRRHLWRGIHDPNMVADGLSPDFDATPRFARFRLVSSAVGHAFPTYVTPKVIMRAVALDRSGNPIPNTAIAYVIQRVVSFSGGRWVETSDTRLMPGQSATLVLPWRQYATVRMWLEVHPDDFYDHNVYDQLAASLDPRSPAARLIKKADALASSSHYRLFETELHRPD